MISAGMKEEAIRKEASARARPVTFVHFDSDGGKSMQSSVHDHKLGVWRRWLLDLAAIEPILNGMGMTHRDEG
jgi:hypothetical protein